VGLIPVIDGAVRHFSAGGLFNGLVLLIDDETRTYWDHITGKALYGPRIGLQMQAFALEIVTVKKALKRWPTLQIAISKPPLKGRIFAWLTGNRYQSGGWYPPGFEKTQGKADERLGAHVSGLGIMVGKTRRFYPFDSLPDRLEDTVEGRLVVIVNDKEAGVPVARWKDTNELPLQALMRWYGFSFTYPGCEIWRPPATANK